MKLCPVCRHPAELESPRATRDAAGECRYYQGCRRCGFVWLDPVPLDNELSEYYQKNTYYGAGATKFPPWIERWIDRFRRKKGLLVATRMKPLHGRVLDVGCGSGRFLEVMQGHGADIYGVELPGVAAERARAIPGMKLHAGPLETFIGEPDSFDVITMWHVLEHMNDPLRALKKCWTYLKPGGYLFIDVPNGDSLQSVWFGARWFHRDPPRHLVQFTSASLQQALEAAGFQDAQLQQCQQEMGVYGFLQSLCNLVVTPRDYLYRVLSLRGQVNGSLIKKAAAVFWGMIFLPIAILLTVSESALGRGAVLRAVARKQEIPT